MKIISKTTALLFTVLIFSLLPGCGSSSIEQSLSADERFERGKYKYDQEDFLDAIDDFTAVTLQFPGSAVADDAQYYLGECRFRREEYLLAAYEYENLKKNMPASSLVPRAQYQIGLCYYDLAPRFTLDQKYSRKAIDEFQTYIEYYPTDELVQDAETKIRELNNRLAEKDYKTAALYMKMEYYKAASYYFESVLEKYHDSDYAEDAFFGKIRSLVERRKYEDALVEARKFLVKYPASQHKTSVESLQNEINDQLKSRSENKPESTSVRLVN